MRRWAVLFSTSRTACSNIAISTTLAARATPTRLMNSRIAAAGTPRRRSPAKVGMRGSSQPVTWPPSTSPPQHPLRHHGIGHVEPRELVLPRPRRHRQIVQAPVVERPMILEFERAQRVRDMFDRIRLAMGEIVGRVDAPSRTGTRMIGMQDPVERRVAQIHVAGSHVDLGTQHAGAVLELARTHAAEQTEVFLDAPVTIRAVPARLRQRAAQ